MSKIIKIGIVGYGNLGRGVEKAISQNPDMELQAIFTRRDPKHIETSPQLLHISKILDFKDKIDVMILCGGSAKDLPEQGPSIARYFNTVDSFDNHGQIPEHFNKMDRVAGESNRLSLISVGWDPGLFSLNRLIGLSILPQGQTYTFWGKGVSQGHSDAIRRVSGVKRGVQYTIPLEDALEQVRSGKSPNLTAGQMHKRVCYVVLEEGANPDQVARDIKEMPNYFADYPTDVNFISDKEFQAQHSNMPHGGFVIRTGETRGNYRQRIEFALALEDNPEFTSSVLVAYARAVHGLFSEGKRGACTIFDIPIGYLSPLSDEELRKKLL